MRVGLWFFLLWAGLDVKVRGSAVAGFGSGCKEWGFRVQDGSGLPGLAGGPMTSPPDGAEGTLSLGRSVEDCKEMPESQKAL